MPVVLNIVESETALGVIESQVVIESASEPGPAGPGVPIGGTAGQVLTKDTATDFDTSWQDASGGLASVVAGSNIDVDATDPANPIVSVETLVDADIPASIARDAEVAAAYATIDEPIAAAHIADTADAHDASAISILDTAGDFTATDVEGALAELQADAEADATALSDHAADTTAVHGIADTSALLDTGDIGTSVQAHSAVLDATTASFLAADETKLDGIAAGATVDQEVFVEDPNTPGTYVVGPVYIGETDPAVGGEDSYVWLDPASLGAPATYVETVDGLSGAVDLSGTYAAVPTAWVSVAVGAGANDFKNSWANFGAGYQGLRYRKNGDVVEIQGMIKSGVAGTVIFTLPAGFRPPAPIIMGGALSSDQQSPRMDIQTNGDVEVASSAYDVTSWIGLALRFSTI